MDFNVFIAIHPLNWHSIGSAILAGLIVGLERQLRGKPVGIGTSVLIVLGTYVFIRSSHFISPGPADSARIIGQVITGIGFLGAGVMLARDGVVIGVTSAATIWVLASIGICIGIGENATAIKLALMIVVVLVGVEVLEGYFQSLTKGVHQRYTGWKVKK